MTATVYTSTADSTSIQAVLDSNFTVGDRLDISIKGNTALITIYNTT